MNIEKTGINSSKIVTIIAHEVGQEDMVIKSIIKNIEARGYFYLNHSELPFNEEAKKSIESLLETECFFENGVCYIETKMGEKLTAKILNINLDNGLH